MALNPVQRMARIEKALLSLAHKSGHAVNLPTGTDPFGDHDGDGTLNIFDTTPFKPGTPKNPGVTQQRYPYVNGVGGGVLGGNASGANVSQLTNTLMAVMLLQLVGNLTGGQSNFGPGFNPGTGQPLQPSPQTAQHYDALQANYDDLYYYFQRAPALRHLFNPGSPNVIDLPANFYPATNPYSPQRYNQLKNNYTRLFNEAKTNYQYQNPGFYDPNFPQGLPDPLWI